MLILLITIVVLAFIFDVINGFHDAANSIATIVSTKVLTPFQAVLWAAFFNFVAYFIAVYIMGEFKIGNTIAKSVHEDYINLYVIFSGLVAAIIWNLFTWWSGIPSSSSHTLIGGFIGAAMAHVGVFNKEAWTDVANYSAVIPIILFIFIAPILGMIISSIITLIILNICKKSNPFKTEHWFKRLQLLSSALFSVGHGSNDAQKVMGIIGAAFIFYEVNVLHAPEYVDLSVADRFKHFTLDYWWVPISSFIAIGLGTMSGGWKIVKTMGSRITKVTPLEGVAAETSGAITLFLSDHLGIPVSTTHTISGSIIGVGLVKRVSAVRWGITIQLLWAWILTIPVSALLAMGIYHIVSLFL
ncbi:MAG: inorganic phosphate transporter [Flavobacteriaceae bacterium]|jgi:PiT family inorganic phosphate transporter|nr:inorganic phosphate transporter [Flavobacteriaceae bacterium]